MEAELRAYRRETAVVWAPWTGHTGRRSFFDLSAFFKYPKKWYFDVYQFLASFAPVDKKLARLKPTGHAAAIKLWRWSHADEVCGMCSVRFWPEAA